MAIVRAVMCLWVVAICAKLVWLQVRQHDELKARAQRQHQFVVDLSPTRGVISDRNGNELARSVEVKSLFASPSQVVDPEGTAARLARILDVDRSLLFKRLTSNQMFIALKRKLTDKEVAAVQALGLPGLSFLGEMKRFYVAGGAAAHVIGFVDIDEHGLGGVELSYNSLIRGRGGRLLIDVDAFKKPYDHRLENAVPGANVTLTIDTLIQHDVERVLADAVRSTEARSGTIIVMRPGSGEVLALANYPSFNPNKVTEARDTHLQNRAIEAAFEPGSIFKIVTYAAALEERQITPRSLIDCGSGEIDLWGHLIRDGHAGSLTATRALEKSSNVAAIKIAQRLGSSVLSRYIESFGFGRRIGVELPGESRGLLRPLEQWQPASIGAIPLGHEVGVTALQALAAFACIANGGEWVRPYVVSRVTSADGVTMIENRPELRRVVSQETADDLKLMLQAVVDNGTGKQAQVRGYRVAGKTGTAQQIDRRTGKYSKTRHVASFAGFAPVNDPAIACIVVIDDAKGAHSGRDVAAPIFSRVVSGVLQVLGVAPRERSRSNMIADNHGGHTRDRPGDQDSLTRLAPIIAQQRDVEAH
jgi:cell division protein FtsI/penicillin-binding protein 2